MKIDLKQLQKIERSYLHDEVTLFSLKQMVNNVLNYNESPYKMVPNNVATAIETLIELRILLPEGSDNPPVQQLNS